MTDPISPELLSNWNQYGSYLAIAIAGIGVLILFGHYLRLLTTSEYKTRYDYINMHEISMLWKGALLSMIGGALYFNTIFEDSNWLWFFVRIFMSSMIAIITGVVIQNILRFYYPFFIEKRLKKLRYTPRTSPDGRKMKLLSEEEEDVCLDEGMQAEENAFSVDYDVWIDEESGYTKIEEYNGRLHALQCSNCNYQTLKVDREEVIKLATEIEEGELMKYYACGYCGHKERKSFKIAKLKDVAVE
ncbi:MAG: hypothetical protein GDA51_01095 [Ekhidna sp.]|nr:hypothetical protein [Ekhidna sp.]